MTQPTIRKLCGYRQGYCTCPGKCDWNPTGFGELLQWGSLQTLAKNCIYYHSPGRPFTFGITGQRRRRDWKVGNPYRKGK